MKRCKSCNTELPLSEFGKNRSKFDGLQSWCRSCQRAACRTTKSRRMVWHECTLCGDDRLVDSRTVAPNLICAKCSYDDMRERNRIREYVLKPVRDERDSVIQEQTESRKSLRDLSHRDARVYKIAAKSLMWVEVLRPRKCSTCDARFVTTSWTRIYCDDCIPESSSRGKWIARGRRLALYERDNWTCQLCDAAVLLWGSTDDPYHPDYATLDHILPRSLGGGDEDENLRTAHFRCNSERGANVTWEFARAA